MANPVCVFCRKRPADPQWRPFCSQRCQIRDLAQWADGTYKVPVEEAEPEPDERQKEKGRS